MIKKGLHGPCLVASLVLETHWKNMWLATNFTGCRVTLWPWRGFWQQVFDALSSLSSIYPKRNPNFGVPIKGLPRIHWSQGTLVGLGLDGRSHPEPSRRGGAGKRRAWWCWRDWWPRVQNSIVYSVYIYSIYIYSIYIVYIYIVYIYSVYIYSIYIVYIYIVYI